MADKQNVTNPAQGGQGEVSSQESGLGDLLDEWNSEPGAKPQQQPNVATKADLQNLANSIKPVVDKVAKDDMKDRIEAAKQAIDDTYAAITDGIEVPEKMKPFVRGWMRDYAVEHPEVEQAFNNRGDNEADWGRAILNMKEALDTEWKEVPVNNVKSDIEAARAAVAGQTTEKAESTLPAPEVMFNMPEDEWNKLLAEESAKAQT